MPSWFVCVATLQFPFSHPETTRLRVFLLAAILALQNLNVSKYVRLSCMQVSTFEARKAKRHARQVALAKLLKAKPAEDADDPR